MFKVHNINSNTLSIKNLILLFLTIVMGFASVITLAQLTIPSSIDNAWQTIGRVTITSDGTASGTAYRDLNANGNGGARIYLDSSHEASGFSGKILGVDGNDELIYVNSSELGNGGGIGGTGDGYRSGDGTHIRNLNAGNVGIGTSSPTSGKLHISSNGETELYLEETNTANAANINLKNTTNTWMIGGFSNRFYIGLNSTALVNITSGGTVGIGTTGPKANLQVIGNLMAGTYNNTITGSNSSIIGGDYNTISGSYASIGGGLYNILMGNASFVGGGENNHVQGYSSNIGGGNQNIVTGDYSVIAGGGGNGPAQGNSVSGNNGFIGGGLGNQILGSNAATIGGGGKGNNISYGDNGFIGGGTTNEISGGVSSTIAGGAGNTITSASYATIGGGQNNSIYKASNAFIGGGGNNVITGNSTTSVIQGGSANLIENSSISFVAGRNAQAFDNFSFVWNSTSVPFATDHPQTFIVNAPGGVGIQTNNPRTALDVSGVIRTRPSAGLGTCDTTNTQGAIGFSGTHFYGCNGTARVQLD